MPQVWDSSRPDEDFVMSILSVTAPACVHIKKKG